MSEVPALQKLYDILKARNLDPSETKRLQLFAQIMKLTLHDTLKLLAHLPPKSVPSAEDIELESGVISVKQLKLINDVAPALQWSP